jgi:K+-transporting ATPase KdpF subunit
LNTICCFFLYYKQIENIMKTKIAASFMSLAVVPPHPEAAVSNGPVSYLIGGIIALLIMGYLIYTLLRPDKF